MRRKAVSLAGDQSQGNSLASLSFPGAGFLKDVLYSGFFFSVLFSQLYIPTPLGQRELLLPVAQWSCLGYFRRRKLVVFYRDLKGSQGFSFSPVQQVTIWYPQSSASTLLEKKYSCILLNRKIYNQHKYRNIYTMQHQHIVDSSFQTFFLFPSV